MQLTEKLNPGDATFERVTAYTYDSRGNKITRTQPNNAVTNYTYDTHNRLATVTNVGAPEESRSYTYNASGAITRMEEHNNAAEYSYDRMGRVVAERSYVRSPLGDLSLRSTIASTYDLVGNRLSVTYPGNRTLTSAYDLRNLLTSVTDGARTTDYTYDNAGNRATMTLPNGVVATYTFDNNNRLTKVEHKNGSQNIYTATYTLDPAGQRTAIHETGLNRQERFVNFAYDNRYQLLTETENGNTVSYTYDRFGNRLTK